MQQRQILGAPQYLCMPLEKSGSCSCYNIRLHTHTHRHMCACARPRAGGGSAGARSASQHWPFCTSSACLLSTTAMRTNK
eukprot:scaffold57698_cov14-Tisochrysis_lutea.AAC.1